MDYSDWLFIDMADLSEAAENMTIADWKNAFPGCQLKGSRQPLLSDWKEVKNISVAFTRVGPTILDRCPHLEWVMVRGHASNCVDTIECKRRGIGVVSAGAFTNNCRDYILNHIGKPPYLFYGHGRIAQAVIRKLIALKDYALGLDGNGIWTVNTKSDPYAIVERLGRAGTIIATVPPPRTKVPPLFSKSFFSSCSGAKFISICHEPLMENEALTWGIQQGYISRAVVDTLRETGKEELLATGKVIWTADSAWKVNFKQAEYQAIIKDTIDKIRAGLPLDGIIVPRRK